MSESANLEGITVVATIVRVIVHRGSRDEQSSCEARVAEGKDSEVSLHRTTYRNEVVRRNSAHSAVNNTN